MIFTTYDWPYCSQCNSKFNHPYKKSLFVCYTVTSLLLDERGCSQMSSADKLTCSIKNGCRHTSSCTHTSFYHHKNIRYVERNTADCWYVESTQKHFTKRQCGPRPSHVNHADGSKEFNLDTPQVNGPVDVDKWLQKVTSKYQGAISRAEATF